jgi:hypothetical protein
MRLKKGVNPMGIRNELMIALIIASDVWKENDRGLVITSLNDSNHSKTSLHYSGCAADLRSRYFENPEQIAVDLRNRLGNNPDYDVVVEKDHIHLEWQPKRK